MTQHIQSCRSVLKSDVLYIKAPSEQYVIAKGKKVYAVEVSTKHHYYAGFFDTQKEQMNNFNELTQSIQDINQNFILVNDDCIEFKD